ncbi:MAG: hypothetical protein WAU91_21030 [Desulfatitalea sp.]
MNTQNASAHLTQAELLKALVDAADLPADQREHLNACPTCDEDFSRLNARLTRIGQMAERLAPKPARAFRLPATQTASARWIFKPVWAVGFVAAMLLAITVFRPQQWFSAPQNQKVAVIDPAADQQLMEEVAALVDNALPAAYQQLASLSEPDAADESQSDEDLLDWILPPLQEDEDDDSLS